MTEPFFRRLNDYYQSVGQVIRGEGDVAAVFPNPTDIGQNREKIYVKYLAQHLPSGCDIFTGGFLFNLKGEESKQIDIVVTSDNSIRYNFFNIEGDSKSFACIEGSLAVVSVKSTLNSEGLKDALENFASLPDKEPLGNKCIPLLKIPEYDEWPFKIIFAIRGASFSTLTRTIQEFYETHSGIPQNKRPNIIHIAGQGAIVRITSDDAKTRSGVIIPKNTFYPQLDVSDVWSLAFVQQKIQQNVLASRHILYNFMPIIDNLPLSFNG